jgi:hypothetical protein
MPNLTTLRTFSFDTSKPDDRAAWDDLRRSLESTHPRCMESISNPEGDHIRVGRLLANAPVDLEIDHLFDNQWNTVSGHRVFDWALDYRTHGPYKTGYYLDQMEWMKRLRSETFKCGYCGASYTHASADVARMFCSKCLGSEHLRPSELQLLRLKPVSDARGKREELTPDEEAWLIPMYREHQGLTRERTQTSLQATRRKRIGNLILVAERACAELMDAARIETAAYTWLMDHGFREIENAIYYKHTKRFHFGWLKPLNPESLSQLLDIIAGFSFDYDITCSDGRKLSS